MEIKIRHRWSNECIWSGEIEDTGDESRNLGAAVVAAHKSGASLVGARLDCARLDGASLDRARLDGARLDGASLDGASLVGASLVGASLDCASLDCARLDRARLDRARLDRARLDGASLDGGEKLLANGIRMIGPIGSRSSYCTAYATDKGLRFRAGCFFGSSDEFRAKIAGSHGDNHHAQEYLAWIAMCEQWFSRLVA